MLSLFLYSAFVSLIIFILTFLLAVVIKNNGIVDILWGLGFVVIAWLVFDPSSTTSLAVTTMCSIWGIRLATHIFARNWGKDEDFRYANWRKEWGRTWVVRTFFQIFLLQWSLMQVVSLPIVFASRGESPTWVLLIGISIWLFGFLYETIGDYQLAVFKRKKSSKGKLMTTGLWSTTRHPNYFGEALLWWGIALIAYASSGSLFVFLGPLTIDFLLLYVSGIPMLEAKYKGRADFREYTKRTPAFFPRFAILKK